MAPRLVVVLALVLFIVTQVAYASDTDDHKSKASSPTSSSDDINDEADFAEPPTGNVIGTLDAADSPSIVQAAPLSGPGGPETTSDASSIKISMVGGVMALVGFFYF